MPIVRTGQLVSSGTINAARRHYGVPKIVAVNVGMEFAQFELGCCTRQYMCFRLTTASRSHGASQRAAECRIAGNRGPAVSRVHRSPRARRRMQRPPRGRVAIVEWLEDQPHCYGAAD